MGGQGSGRPTKEESILRTVTHEPVVPIANQGSDIIIPNHSGDHSRGVVNTTPSQDTDIANKKYVDDNIGGGGGSGTMKTVKEDGAQLGGADITTLDFLGADFNLTESPDKEVNIVINDAGIDHDSTTNFVANEHIDHTSVTLTAGTGLSGGGDISTNRTFNLDTVSIANGGTGQTGKTAAFDSLSPTTTKGDVIVNNGSDNIRVAVGDDDQVLTADSSEASGVKWAAGGGGGSDTNAVAEYNWMAAQLLPVEPGDSIAPLLKKEGTNVDLMVRAFDDSTDEGAGGSFVVPSDVKAGSTITFRAVWYAENAGPTTVKWNFKHMAVSEGEDWDQAFTTEAAGEDDAQSSGTEIVTTTWTETLSNTGWAASDLVNFIVERDSTDTLSGDANLISFSVEIPRA